MWEYFNALHGAIKDVRERELYKELVWRFDEKEGPDIDEAKICTHNKELCNFNGFIPVVCRIDVYFANVSDKFEFSVTSLFDDTEHISSSFMVSKHSRTSSSPRSDVNLKYYGDMTKDIWIVRNEGSSECISQYILSHFQNLIMNCIKVNKWDL